MNDNRYTKELLLGEIAEAERTVGGHTQTVACYSAAILILNERIRVLRVALSAVEWVPEKEAFVGRGPVGRGPEQW